jgi:hypothetical protein
MKLSSIPPLLLLGIVCQGQTAVMLAQSSGVFSATGYMITPRSDHSATLLPNGKVLLVGGDRGPLPIAELYDPSTGLFTVTGTPITNRRLHATVLLPNGRVLIVGGTDDGSAEVYDPASESFSLVDSIVRGSYSFFPWTIATLLNDGGVLIVRGTAPPYSTRNAGVYDPATGTFTPTGEPVWDHLAPASTLLADGRFLIVEGRDFACETIPTPGLGPYPCGGTEIYDPAAGTFSATGAVSGDPWRGGPTSTLLANGQVLVAFGDGGNSYLNDAQLYNPLAGAFTTIQALKFERISPTSTLLPDGVVLLAGGNRDAANESAFGAELYDPSTGSDTATADMIAYRLESAATLLLDGSVLITGGDLTGSAEIFHPAIPILAPVLFSLLGDGRGQGAIWNPATGLIASPDNPALAGTVLTTYTTSLIDGGAIPPQVAVGGRLAEVLFFGPAPGYPGYYQVNFRAPGGVGPGQAVPVRLTYIGRPSNTVTIGMR